MLPSINNKINNSKGFSMVLALFAMLIISLLVSVAIPYTIQSTNLNVKNRDAIEAQYAAEAGVKRVLVLMSEADKNIDWSWADGNTQNSFTDDAENKYYITSISPPIADDSGPIPGKPYTIKSTGYINNFEKKLSVKVDAPGIMSYGIMAQTLDLPCKSLLAYATNKLLEVLKNVLSDILTGDTFPGGESTTTKSGYSYLGNQENTHYPDYDYKTFKHDAKPLPQLVDDGSVFFNKKYYHLTDIKYYHDGDLTIDKTEIIIDGGPAVLFVNGDVNVVNNLLNNQCGDYFQVLGDSVTAPVCIIATGDITYNTPAYGPSTNTDALENAVLYAQGNITFKSSIVAEKCILITPGTLALDTIERDLKVINVNDLKVKTSSDQAANLAAAFNQIMTPYEIIKPYNWER